MHAGGGSGSCVGCEVLTPRPTAIRRHAGADDLAGTTDDRRLGLPKDASVIDAVALGVSRRKLATTVLLEAKRALEAQREYPVMVAVDEFSEWWVRGRLPAWCLGGAFVWSTQAGGREEAGLGGGVGC